MRSLHSLTAAFVASLAVAVTLSAQTTVSTVPVGFNTVTIPAGKSNVVSVPFYQVAKFQGANSAVGSNTLTFSGTTFTTTLPAANAPYLARMKTGASTGRFF